MATYRGQILGVRAVSKSFPSTAPEEEQEEEGKSKPLAHNVSLEPRVMMQPTGHLGRSDHVSHPKSKYCCWKSRLILARRQEQIAASSIDVLIPILIT